MATKTKEIRTKEFEVPKELMAEFFMKVEELELDFDFEKINYEEEELVISISYAPDLKGDMMDLIELLEDYYNDEEEDDE